MITDWSAISREIETATRQEFRVVQGRSISGGDISDAYVIEDSEKRYFVKTNNANRLPMFDAEYDGLMEIKKSNSIRTPLPICKNSTENYSFIVLEFVNFSSPTTSSAQQVLGAKIAAMHGLSADRFGWYRENTIGSTQQINTQSSDWISFYRTQRLGFQLSLALQRGASRKLAITVDKLCDNLECFFTSYSPLPSLLHGDLWSGNCAFSDSDEPVIFDPATYYGDREADIAMTKLFGGFSDEFHEAYNEVYKLDDGFAVRKNLYNLYHVINHFNLFGGSYEGQAIDMGNRLLAEI